MSDTASDRYRIRFTRGSVFARLTSKPGKPSKRGPTVSILDESGNEVWHRVVATVGEGEQLVRLIRDQVLTARVQDFEHWLRTEGQA